MKIGKLQYITFTTLSTLNTIFPQRKQYWKTVIAAIKISEIHFYLMTCFHKKVRQAIKIIIQFSLLAF